MPKSPLEQAFALYRRGDLAAAERLCEQLLREQPSHCDLWRLLGIIALQLGRTQRGVELLGKAVELNPAAAISHLNLGQALVRLGRFDQAFACFDTAIALRPGFAEAYLSRGNTLCDLERFNEALTEYGKAIAFKPDYAEAFNNRGLALCNLKRLDEALADYDNAVALKPDSAEVYNNRGIALYQLLQFEQALASYDKAIALKPDFAEAYNNRGNALYELRRFESALASYDNAIALNPSYAEAYYNRGSAYKELTRFDEALASYDKAIALRADYAEAYNNRGEVLLNQKRFDQAFEYFERAIALKPGLAIARRNRAFLLLLLGRFEEGFREYEGRDESRNLKRFLAYPQPRWLGGENVAGKTLLIHGELNFGDILHLCRYARVAEAHGAKVILLVQSALRKLLMQLGPSIEIVSEDEEPPRFDLHCPLVSLPFAFKTTIESIPAEVPYLRAEEARVKKWRERLGEKGFKIGICWQGSTLHYAIALNRSCGLTEFRNISELPNVRLISLQKCDGVEQLAHLPEGMKVETLGEEFDAGPNAFLDTAAVMECLDLVITVDTSIAHLAGALARPTWVALKYVPEWRWLLDRSDSPWYPTMRLFRQSSQGDWKSVFAAMETQLVKLNVSEPRQSQKLQFLASPRVPISWGELFDKIAILEIKSERLTNEVALANVRGELTLLCKTAKVVLADNGVVAGLALRLRAINEILWDIEDRIRDKEATAEFDKDFVELARSVYKSNDERAALKKEINLRLASELVEEKSYNNY